MDTVNRIIEKWFLNEPALFAVTCTHSIVENRHIACPVRSGQGRIEYNPDFLSPLEEGTVEELLRNEAVRILLKHPYSRRPDGCCAEAVSKGSNLVIGDNYGKDSRLNNLEYPEDFALESNQTYEWYSREIQKRMPPLPGGEEPCAGQGQSSQQNGGQDPQQSPSGGNRADQDLSALWDEDEMQCQKINEVIKGLQSWGSLPGGMVENIQASTRAKVNWRNILSGFRASVLSSERHLTRMRPSRRSGFEQMGSQRHYTTRILVAVDVSGSISDENLSYFFGVINSAFRYGVQDIDTVQFDCGVTTVQPIRQALKRFTVTGRGGTSFQEPVDFACQQGYDGLVILTDGYAPEPTVPAFARTKIMWVCDNQRDYDAHHEWMSKYGRVCAMELR